MLRVLDAWREKRHQRATYHQLASLDPALLSDIGITPEDMEALRRGRRHNRASN